uniref:Uncharacterized protein n=1 Tax=Candidatus Kentrum sp. LPFa TaxID=2126335 RepID=A0A450W5U2_9GAMM|nr:MAG: hypothetical protein BECKLPF1236A_GA0070988_1006815 [Candidatus Kentron sp. LPFa]VFK24318.1 MAG: hypothetical protein BECKLPF1236C_GA0070990_1001225 [Candidatus Kentron sp. LPFa]
MKLTQGTQTALSLRSRLGYIRPNSKRSVSYARTKLGRLNWSLSRKILNKTIKKLEKLKK